MSRTDHVLVVEDNDDDATWMNHAVLPTHRALNK